MSVILGSARIDERGNIRGGLGGDQTGREVCRENWYNHSQGWITLRAKDPVVADKIAKAMERACDNESIGYDQYQRNSLYNTVKNKFFDPALATICETDCSALVRVCLAYAGIHVPDFNTSTERKVILDTGKFEQVPTSEGTAKRGDILVTKTKGHTVVVLSSSHSYFLPDISNYHHVSDWKKVKAVCPFLISRATQGTGTKTTANLINGVDRYLYEFIEGCEKHKIPYWLYCYLDKGNEKKQAEFMVNICKGRIGQYFVGYILDVEANNAPSDVREAMEYLVTRSGKIMVYTMYAQYQMYAPILQKRSSNICWWEARYGKNDGYYSSAYPCHPGVDLHQYTSEGRVSGIEGRVDLSRLTGTKDLEWFYGAVKPDVLTPSPTPKNGYTYAVKAGGKRYPAVTDLEDYAGSRGKAITDVAIKNNNGSVKYRVHIKGGKWLPWVTGYNWADYDNGYAGTGKVIDAIQVDGKCKYRVSPLNKNYYDWQRGTETTNSQDGYAGSFGVAIDRFQITTI